MCTAGQRVSLTINGPGPSFLLLRFLLLLLLPHPLFLHFNKVFIPLLLIGGLPPRREISTIKGTISLPRVVSTLIQISREKDGRTVMGTHG